MSGSPAARLSSQRPSLAARSGARRCGVRRAIACRRLLFPAHPSQISLSRVTHTMRFFRLPLLLVLSGLAGCASQPSPSSAPLPPLTAPPQPSAAAPFFTQTGLASFYGHAHDGKTTANGENFDHRDFTAAHRTLAFGTSVRVTNLENGQAVTVKITDRGPFVRGRIIDVSLAAARALGIEDKGVTRVRLEAFRVDLPTS